MTKIKKKDRLRLIKEIISSKEIHHQSQLLVELKKRSIHTTQATISRDLRQIDIMKIKTENGFKYKLADPPGDLLLGDQLTIVFANFVKNIRSTENLIVIKTASGNANTVAIIIDQMNQQEILGTIAGDDTILIIVDTKKNRLEIEKTLKSYLKS